MTETITQLRERVASPERFRRRVERLLSTAGIIVGGDQPWDPHIHDERFYARVLAEGALGLGEAYMDGWWDCDQLDAFICRVVRARLHKRVARWLHLVRSIEARVYNLQKPTRAFEVGRRHYDIGNALYERMLDRRMTYSCGYWKDARTLDEAQEAKLDLVCRKLGLEEGMRVLDIGCGWGGAVQFAAERYGVEAVGITISTEQARLARERCRGLPVEIRLQDYRDLPGETFDRVFSIGMFEHVGYKNYDAYLRVVRRCLKDGGLFLLHTIGSNRSRARTDAWTERYIFPNSMTPSARQLTEALEELFVIEDWHSFGAYYDPTLMQWFKNFDAHWDELRALNPQYDERFYRMWTYYLRTSAGSFRARGNQLWQLVLSPHGVPGGYTAPR